MRMHGQLCTCRGTAAADWPDVVGAFAGSSSASLSRSLAAAELRVVVLDACGAGSDAGGRIASYPLPTWAASIDADTCIGRWL